MFWRGQRDGGFDLNLGQNADTNGKGEGAGRRRGCPPPLKSLPRLFSFLMRAWRRSTLVYTIYTVYNIYTYLQKCFPPFPLRRCQSMACPSAEFGMPWRGIDARQYS